MFHRLLRNKIERLEHELETSQAELARERAGREHAEKMRAASERDAYYLQQRLQSKEDELDFVRRRIPPSNVLKAIHTIQGIEIVEAQDGSLWQRDGDGWKNINLPDTSAAKD